MPQRVADVDVQAILHTSISLQPFIVAASLVIDQHLLTAGLSDALLLELERWLAAHFACIRDPRLHEFRDGDTGVRYERGTQGEGLKATSYGQQVLVLDPTGILAQVVGMRRATFEVF
jgi:hypothetical protein